MIPRSSRFSLLLGAFSLATLVSIAVLGTVFIFLGIYATLVAALLALVEILFSFENAIINAKVISVLSPFWRRMFLTVGILIAVFGMRIVFPIIIVSVGAGLGVGEVINLALYDPEDYAHHIEKATPVIEAFGGMFLLTLAMQFFLSPDKEIHWLTAIERPLKKVGNRWAFVVASVAVLGVVVAMPVNNHQSETLIAGGIGILSYLMIHGVSDLFGRQQPQGGRSLKTGVAGFFAFLYLEMLDASFSLDGVIGAFAVTNQVALIAAGLGIGAIWVRSLTVYMVRKKTLQTYQFIEHGAHYTVLLLAVVMLLELFIAVPGALVGVAGVAIVGLAAFSSKKTDVVRIKAVEA